MNGVKAPKKRRDKLLKKDVGGDGGKWIRDLCGSRDFHRIEQRMGEGTSMFVEVRCKCYQPIDKFRSLRKGHKNRWRVRPTCS